MTTVHGKKRLEIERLVRERRRRQEAAVWEQRGRAYSDLLIEVHETLMASSAAGALPGVETTTVEHDVAKVTRMAVKTLEAARAMGKAVGYYSTIEAEALRERNEEAHQAVADLLAQEVEHFLERMGIGPEDPVLVVGLGNWNSTPDSVGPKVAGEMLVTRHLHQMVPPEARGGLRPLSSLSPGVLGLTGIETAEIVYGVVQRIQPSLVICVDALAARSTRRLATTIQMSDAGIHPGSGVGNKRFSITRESMGVPVLAVGVPTVVHAATIISDGLEMVARGVHNGVTGTGDVNDRAGRDTSRESQTVIRPDPAAILKSAGGGETGAPGSMAGRVPGGVPGSPYSPPAAPPMPFSGLDPFEKERALRALLDPFMGDLIVTTKDVDVLVDDIVQTLASGLNAGLHRSLDLSNVLQYLM